MRLNKISYFTFYIFINIILVLTLCHLILATPTRYKPLGLERPTDPTAFWVEVDMPEQFTRARYNNFTFHFWNVVFNGPGAQDVLFSFESSSPTFSIPELQPEPSNKLCFDQHGFYAGFFRSQSTFIEIEIRQFKQNTTFPYFALQCIIYCEETNLTANTNDTTFTLTRYNMDRDIIQPLYTFHHPPTINPIYDIQMLHSSLRRVVGGFEVSFGIYSNAPGELNLQINSMNANILQSQYSQYKHTRNKQHQLSYDYYGRFNQTTYFNDTFSYNHIVTTHPISDIIPIITDPLATTTTSNYCYLASNDNLFESNQPTIFELDNWLELPLQYQRSAVLTIHDPPSKLIQDAKILIAIDGFHICRIFVETYINSLSIAMTDTIIKAYPTHSFPRKTFTIPSNLISIPYPSWHLTSTTPSLISLSYRLPGFQRGDLILLNKNYFNSLLFQPIPWYVDQTISPATPTTCIPFSINGTYIAFVYLPALFDTYNGKQYARAMDCTINLHPTPGHYQQEIDLMFSILPRSKVPYTSPTSYENIRQYNDIYNAININEIIPLLNQADHNNNGNNNNNKEEEKKRNNNNKNNNDNDDMIENNNQLIRILSTNLGLGHFYSYQIDHHVGDMVINDVFGVNFDLFSMVKPIQNDTTPSPDNNESMILTSQQSIINQDLYHLHNLHISSSESIPVNSTSFQYNVSIIQSQDEPLQQQQQLQQLHQLYQLQEQEQQQSEPIFTTLQSTQAIPTTVSNATGLSLERQYGYRLISLSVSPVGMDISGTSLFDDYVNAHPKYKWKDINDNGDSILIDRTISTLSSSSSPSSSSSSSSSSSTTATTTQEIPSKPIQPLHLVLDLDYSFINAVDDSGLDLISVYCYYINNGESMLPLNIAWGRSELYSQQDDFINRLYIQLPSTQAGKILSIRCQVPLPIFMFRYTTTRIGYFIQPGSILEIHSLDMYNKYTNSSFTSIMQRNKVLFDSENNNTNNDDNNQFKIISVPQEYINTNITNANEIGRNKLKDPKKYIPLEPINFLLPSTNINPISNTTLEMFIYANTTFVLDYGILNNTITHHQFINTTYNAGLHDFILPIGNFYRFKRTNNNALINIPVPTKQLANKIGLGSYYALSEPTSLYSTFQFSLRGEIKTASIDIYQNILNTFIDLIYTTTTANQTMTYHDLQSNIKLLSIAPIYGTAPYSLEAYRDRFHVQRVSDYMAVSLNGPDSNNDETWAPTRLLLTFGINAYNSTTNATFSSPDISGFFYSFAEGWRQKFIDGTSQFVVEGQSNWSTSSFVTFDACVLNATTPTITNDPGDENNNNNNNNNNPQQPFHCGCICDLLCPDDFPCVRDSDCYHGNCNGQVCGPTKSKFNLTMIYEYNSSYSIYSSFFSLSSFILIFFFIFVSFY